METFILWIKQQQQQQQKPYSEDINMPKIKKIYAKRINHARWNEIYSNFVSFFFSGNCESATQDSFAENIVKPEKNISSSDSMTISQEKQSNKRKRPVSE